MSAFLLPQALAQHFEQLVETSHRLDLPLLFFGQIFLGKLLEPLRRDFRLQRLIHRSQSLEYAAKTRSNLSRLRSSLMSAARDR